MYLIILAGSRVPVKSLLMFLALVAGLLAIMAASALFAPCVACVGGLLASLAGAGLVLAKLTVALGAVAIIASLGTKSMEAPQWM